MEGLVVSSCAQTIGNEVQAKIFILKCMDDNVRTYYLSFFKSPEDLIEVRRWITFKKETVESWEDFEMKVVPIFESMLRMKFKSVMYTISN